ncbi:MFS transporter [Dyella solisilvae]|uniref:MFS transporter n=1 Tax=Dyella solisilvae TaxID=1920168 RepID=A0A370KAL4_9GAMM|nr:MFS transporter [Dyella solisilvae]RDI99692.1 MFS transporter [Dyella solisilvae]
MHYVEASTLGAPVTSAAKPRVYAWLVFALTFGLLLSDYMSRQVLNAVFPLLKAEWGLSDTQLGSLSGIVALLVGLLTFPLSVLADRWGRVRSIILMATLWTLATLACGVATGYGQMFVARFFVGLGEAAYGSVGVAVIISIFPAHLRSTLTGAFMAGGAFGSVVGMAMGGVLATRLGWRWAFVAMAIFGAALLLLYALTVTERRLREHSTVTQPSRDSRPGFSMSLRALFSGLFSTTSVICAYIGSGLQLFIMAAVIAWMPSYLNRYYAMTPDKAGVTAAAFVLIGAMGMVVCGIVTDRLCRQMPARKMAMAIVYCLVTAILLGVAFQLPPGLNQLVMIGLGMFLAAGTSGPAGAMVANLTPTPIHASAFATLTLANNLLGLAPGPLLTGVLADHIGLLGAFKLIPMMGIFAAVAFWIGRHHYGSDLSRIQHASGAAAH